MLELTLYTNSVTRNRTVTLNALTARYAMMAAQYLFESVAQVQEFAERWIWIYNHERPNMAIGGITPKQKLALAA